MDAAAISSTMGAKQRRVSPLQRLGGFYRMAKRQAWDIDDLPWDRLPPVPGAEHERWGLLWASFVPQQLQADRIAIAAATRLSLEVPEAEARFYHVPMVQDEARHVEGWYRLLQEMEAVKAESPFLAEMGELLRAGQTLEGQVIMISMSRKASFTPTRRLPRPPNPDPGSASAPPTSVILIRTRQRERGPWFALPAHPPDRSPGSFSRP